jgi:hypothetical protein
MALEMYQNLIPKKKKKKFSIKIKKNIRHTTTPSSP